ncbi:hypothetical protein RXV86_03740 [Alisedimentitalea sp. MJ-SS2]|uniref:hypothetical protein n=1 Tax=Aliisedimentitalea sp. MJ-SS2 TaxID=3049795 RepID=UPI00290FB631|nr:hypothetical protein [Alisedimentitalea sp. MJ-SS2]MDU8926490.1 hypothetical protein [Alisedimentitalea sp. MJ-SS2]
MRRVAMVLVAAFIGQGVAADAWRAMSGQQILEELTDRELVYDGGAWQRFNASGRTLYNAGTDSWGYWSVRGDQYCSQWPPDAFWACYDMAMDGERFRFVDAFGNVSAGTRKPVKGE